MTELDPVWTLPPTDIVKALWDVVPALVDKWGVAAASVAADWYDHTREHAGTKGRFTAIVPHLDLGGKDLAGWGGQPLHQAHLDLVPLKTITPIHTISDPSEPVQLDKLAADGTLSPLDSARSRVEGGLQKRVVNAANITVTVSVAEDPQCDGYVRVTRPGACKFCIMVASSGVFKKASATFACHDHCYCQAVPLWGGDAISVKKYTPSQRPQTAKQRAQVRKWIADNL